MADMRIYRDPNGSWSALYVDGHLQIAGDHYLATEQAFERAGVLVIDDDSFLRGQDQRAGVAQTVAEVQAYHDEQERRHQKAAQLRVQAAKMVAQADALDGKPVR
jgi:hypothetical protein